MNTQLKSLSVFSFSLALLSAIIASRLLYINWFQWQVSIKDQGSGYEIEMISNKVTTSKMLEDINFPSHIAKIYSPNGECWWGNINLEISASDRLKEKWSSRILYFGIFASYIIGFLSFISLVCQWWKKYLNSILFLMGVSLTLLILSRLLGPRTSVDPDFSAMDFYCRFDLVLNANMVSINPQAIALIVFSALLGLIAVFILIREWSIQKRLGES